LNPDEPRATPVAGAMPTATDWHDVQWTPEKIAAFWDRQARVGSARYYSDQLGTALVRWVGRRVPLRGQQVLDFGCGPGFLLERLQRGGAVLSGCDTSSASLQEAQRRAPTAELRHYQQLPTSFATAQFSVVWFVETIEHLLPEERTAILTELRRLLRPAGYLIVTTPNAEVLARSHVICPDCGCRFHRIQHITSWTEGTLVQELAAAGFTVAACQAVHLTEEGWYSRFRGWLSARFRGYRPNLVYIGRRDPS